MKLIDIVTWALAVFKTSISNNGEFDEWEFIMLQTFHLGVLNELANVDHKMHALPCVLFLMLPQHQKFKQHHLSCEASTTN